MTTSNKARLKPVTKPSPRTKMKPVRAFGLIRVKTGKCFEAYTFKAVAEVQAENYDFPIRIVPVIITELAPKSRKR